MDIKSLKESIEQVVGVQAVSEEGDNASNFTSLINDIKESFLSNFPNGFIKLEERTSIGHSIIVRFGLIGNLDDVTNRIRENDPMYGAAMIWLDDAPEISVKLSVGGFSVKPEPGSYMAMGRVKYPWRNFKTTDPAKVSQQFKVFFSRLKDVAKANQENFYQVDRIPKQYFVESNVTEEDEHPGEVGNYAMAILRDDKYINTLYGKKSAQGLIELMKSQKDPLEIADIIMNGKPKINTDYGMKTKAGIADMITRSRNDNGSSNVEESLTGNSNPTVNIGLIDLLGSSKLISKYPGGITISPISKNKFTLTLEDQSLINKDPLIAKLFSKGGSQVSESDSNPIPAGYENPKEVFSNESGKVVETLKGGKSYFFSVLSDGTIMGNGRPISSKTVAVSLLKAVSRSKQQKQ